MRTIIIKASSAIALLVLIIQLLCSAYFSDAGFVEYSFVGLISFIIVFFGTFLILDKWLLSPIKSFDEQLKKIAVEDGNFETLLRGFVTGQSNQHKGQLSITSNLAKFIQRLLKIIDEVNESAIQLADNSGRAITVAEKTSAGIIQQYDESNAVSSTTENISSAVGEVADNSNSAANAAKLAGEYANTGQSVIEGVINSINELAQNVNDAATGIDDLAHQSEKIGTIVSVISDISNQTNLLALNAAIEAARAGETGRGFAVVAEEVRELSKRTAEATTDIQEMITQLQNGSQKAVALIIDGKNKADESVETALKARDSLSQITDAVNTITEMSVQTALAVEAQSESVQNIHTGLQNLSNMIDETAIHSEESAAAAQEQTLMVDYIRAMLNLQNSEVSSRTIKIYSYQNMPPFVIAKGEGLTYELANYLNKKLNGDYKFVVYRLPRVRADKLIDKAESCIIPWTSPAWHGDPEATKYTWSSGYTDDANCIISPSAKPFEYKGPDSMKGKVMGGLIGYFYVGLDDLIEQGELKRIDVSQVRENFARVLSNRIDTALITESTARYLVNELNIKNKIHFSKQNHQDFCYQMMCVSLPADLVTRLKDITKDMRTDQEWLSILSRYR